MGKTSILKFGPVCPDIEALLNEFSVDYKKIDYKETAVFKEINKFIDAVNCMIKVNQQQNILNDTVNKMFCYPKTIMKYHNLSLQDLSNKFNFSLL